jgi:LPS-assembly lipoprotein
MRILALLLILVLGACGFKPSNVIDLSYSQTPFTVSSNDPFSGLADNIERSLSRAGVRIAAAGEPANSISILEERVERKALSLDRNARVTEYTLRYRVRYSLSDVNGKTLIDNQTIELRRDFNYDVNVSAGSPAEEALLKGEMQAEMVRSILRRTSIVLHSQIK